MWVTQEKLREESLILHVWQFVTHSATHSVTQKPILHSNHDCLFFFRPRAESYGAYLLTDSKLILQVFAPGPDCVVVRAGEKITTYNTN